MILDQLSYQTYCLLLPLSTLRLAIESVSSFYFLLFRCLVVLVGLLLASAIAGAIITTGISLLTHSELDVNA